MAMAAMDVGDLVAADGNVMILRQKFPGSQRVKRLEGMMAEARGDFATAGNIYKEMVEENPSNQLARKRQVRASEMYVKRLLVSNRMVCFLAFGLFFKRANNLLSISPRSGSCLGQSSQVHSSSVLMSWGAHSMYLRNMSWAVIVIKCRHCLVNDLTVAFFCHS